jgi:hypothetical protein
MALLVACRVLPKIIVKVGLSGQVHKQLWKEMLKNMIVMVTVIIKEKSVLIWFCCILYVLGKEGDFHCDDFHHLRTLNSFY